MARGWMGVGNGSCNRTISCSISYSSRWCGVEWKLLRSLRIPTVLLPFSEPLRTRNTSTCCRSFQSKWRTHCWNVRSKITSLSFCDFRALLLCLGEDDSFEQSDGIVSIFDLVYGTTGRNTARTGRLIWCLPLRLVARSHPVFRVLICSPVWVWRNQTSTSTVTTKFQDFKIIVCRSSRNKKSWRSSRILAPIHRTCKLYHKLARA